MTIEDQVTEQRRAKLVERQNAFDDDCERIRAEGRVAFTRGLPISASPYKRHSQAHFHNSWVGGWAEAALGL